MKSAAALLTALCLTGCELARTLPRSLTVTYGNGDQTLSATATWDPPSGKHVARTASK